MPIKGISDVTRLPRLGKIHLGEKEISERTKSPYPKATDYFVCPPQVQKVFGEKPKELRIMFPTEDEDRWASQFLRCYSATRGLICRGDGEMADALIDLKTGEIVSADTDSRNIERREITCAPKQCPKYQRGHCRETMFLQFLLPEVPGLGVWQIDTSSFYSIVNINNAIKLIKALCGRISMIPLLLTLEPQEVYPGGKKKTV